jgi:hypothetical protein
MSRKTKKKNSEYTCRLFQIEWVGDASIPTGYSEYWTEELLIEDFPEDKVFIDLINSLDINQSCIHFVDDVMMIITRNEDMWS